MTDIHPNVALLSRFDPANVAGATDIFAKDVVCHFFNPRLPSLQGDYVGCDGLQAFFEQLSNLTGGAFQVTPVSIIPIGDELLVTHTRILGRVPVRREHRPESIHPHEWVDNSSPAMRIILKGSTTSC